MCCARLRMATQTKKKSAGFLTAMIMLAMCNAFCIIQPRAHKDRSMTLVGAQMNVLSGEDNRQLSFLCRRFASYSHFCKISFPYACYYPPKFQQDAILKISKHEHSEKSGSCRRISRKMKV